MLGMIRTVIIPALAIVSLGGCSLVQADPLAEAQHAFAAQDYVAARDHAQAALVEDPRDSAALALIARTQLAMGLGSDALATLARMEESGSLPDDARLIEAEARLQIGEMDAVSRLLQGETSAESWRLRALMAAMAGDEAGALAAFARGRSGEGEKHRLYTAEANFHLTRGNAAAARDAVAQAQLAAPQSIETLFVSARLAQLSGEPELASRAYLAILEIAPLDRPALLGAIAELGNADRVDLLRPLVVRGRAAYPEDIEFFYLTARLKADEGDWAGVRDLLQQREGEVSAHPDARGLYGQALLELGQVELARAQLAPLYRRYPDNPMFARTYARVLLENGEAGEARQVIAPFASLPNAEQADRDIAQRAAAG
jgi:thioredoxin-like negative regulator of GroEL